MGVKLMASMLTADHADLGGQCRQLEEAGLDGIQWDVMDGVAVPSLSFGPDVIAACRDRVELPFEAHVMVRDPGTLLPQLRDAGCDLVIVHPDLLSHPWRTAERIRDLGMRCGMALSPGIPVTSIRWLVDAIDQILVMTVEPGFGGQRYLAAMEAKVAEVAQLVERLGGGHEIEVDGGIAPDTITGTHRAGAGTFVVGSALWRAPSFEVAVQQLRARCEPVETGTRGIADGDAAGGDGRVDGQGGQAAAGATTSSTIGSLRDGRAPARDEMGRDR